MTAAGRGGGATARRLLDHLHRRRAAMTEVLERLVALESPSTVPASQAGVQRELERHLAGSGFRVRRVAGRRTGGLLLAVPRDRRPGQPIQLLVGHGDTVWPLGTLAEMPLAIRDGRLYGPGAYDMKSGLVEILFALAGLRALGLEPEVAPVVFVNSDEEIGSPESFSHVRRLARCADRAFVLEPSLGPSGKLKTARKGGGEFIVRVFGRAAHAGLEPERGASAIVELSLLIQKLAALNDPERGITVNVGTIDGGIRPNVVAAEAWAEVDVRVLAREDARRLETAILGLQAETPGTRLKIEGGVRRPPMERTPGNRRLWYRAQEAAAELGLAIDEGTSGGGSDGNTTSLYTPTLDGLGAVGDGAHSPEEHVELGSLAERTALLARLLLDPPLHAGAAAAEDKGS